MVCAVLGNVMPPGSGIMGEITSTFVLMSGTTGMQHCVLTPLQIVLYQ